MAMEELWNPGPPPSDDELSKSCTSCHRVIGMFAHLRRAEGEDDMCFWDAGLYQFGGDAVFGVVGLDPHFVGHDVDVHERVVDALVAVPAESHEYETAAGAIKDRFAGQIAVGVGNL